MVYIVKVALMGGMEWPEEEVEADEKWDALVKYAEKFSLTALFTMTTLWKGASIVKKDRKEFRRWRKPR